MDRQSAFSFFYIVFRPEIFEVRRLYLFLAGSFPVLGSSELYLLGAFELGKSTRIPRNCHLLVSRGGCARSLFNQSTETIPFVSLSPQSIHCGADPHPRRDTIYSLNSSFE